MCYVRLESKQSQTPVPLTNNISLYLQRRNNEFGFIFCEVSGVFGEVIGGGGGGGGGGLMNYRWMSIFESFYAARIIGLVKSRNDILNKELLIN